jgi:hypothetical protein
MKLTVVCVLALLGASALGQTGPADAVASKSSAATVSTRRPIPNGDRLRDVVKLIHDAYATEFTRHDAASRSALAATLLNKAADNSDDPVSRYALLSEAHDVAVSSGDLMTALAAIDRMASEYAVDGLAMKDATLNRLAPRASTPEAREAARQAGYDLAEEALRAGKAPVAEGLAKTVESLAAGKSAEIAASTHAWVAEVRALAPLAAAGREAIDKRTTETDGHAATAAGTFLCMIAGDWTKGLPLLARGSDTALASLAKRELGADADKGPAALAAVAGAWLDYAAKQGSATRARWAEHALTLYRASVPRLQGLARVSPEKREAEAEAKSAGHWIVDLLALADPARDAIGDLSAWRAVRGTLVATGANQTRLQLPYRAPAEYDLNVECTRTKDTNDFVLALVHGKYAFHFDCGGHGGGQCWFGDYKGKAWGESTQSMRPLRNDAGHRCTVQVRDSGCRVFVDGTPIMLLPGSDYPELHAHAQFAVRDPRCLGIGCWHCTYVFQAVEVTEVRGRGELALEAGNSNRTKRELSPHD